MDGQELAGYVDQMSDERAVLVHPAKLVSFAGAELDTQEWGIFDDNGGEPDGDMWLLPLDEVTPFPGMEVVDGFIVDGYTSNAGYHSFCGFSSRDVAYTLDRDVADAIAQDEWALRVTEE